MPPPEVWGPPIWTLFHTLIEKVKDDEFQNIYIELFNNIKSICSYLPCPDCSLHAKQFLNTVKIQTISTKKDFKDMLYVFHNSVNKRKKKELFNYSQLSEYENKNIKNCYNEFMKVYNIRERNIKLLADSFQRQRIIKSFNNWLFINNNSFIQT